MGSLSFSPSLHLLHSEFSHAVIPELSCAARPAPLLCSFPDAPQLSPLFTTPWEVLFSPQTTCSGCWLVTHAGTGLAEHPPALEAWRQLLPLAQEVLPASLHGPPTSFSLPIAEALPTHSSCFAAC